MPIQSDRRPTGMFHGVRAALGRLPGRIHAFLNEGEFDVSRERERFQLALELSSAAMVMSDRLGRIVLTNGVAECLFGYAKEELHGKTVESLMPLRFQAAHPGHRAGFHKEPGAKRAMGVGRDLHALRKDGTEFPAEIGLSRMQGREGEYVVATIIDITERKRAEQALRRSAADLESFVYTVSHDLRSPIRAIQGYAHFVLKRLGEGPDPESLLMLRRISDCGVRLDHLIRDLLSYSAISREVLALAPVDLDKLVAEIVGQYPDIGKARVRVRGPLGKVLAQESLLTQALSNVLGNAAKFVLKDKTPEIDVWTEIRESGKVRLIIQDNGVGISREHWSRIFDPFEKLPVSETREGTGIGLAIARKAVERLGGSISVESEPGKGSRFQLELAGCEHAA